jgi:tetratricopeptide (TPR) repeat protein
MTRAITYCSRLWTGFTPSIGIEQFEDDFENSMFLLDWAFNAQRWLDVVSLSRKIDPYMSVRGLAEERIEVCDVGMLAARYVKDGRSIVELQEAKGKAYKQKGMFREAEEQLRECLEFYRNTDMPREVARIGMQLGILLEHQVEYSVDPVPVGDRVGRLENAVTEYTEAYRTFQSLEDRAAQAQVLHLIGRALRHLNRLGESEKMLLLSIQIKRELGDVVRIAITEHELARLRFLQGKNVEAEALYRKSIAALTGSLGQ